MNLRDCISDYLSADNAKIFVSGAYIGTDLDLSGDTLMRNFANDVLHYRFITNHATKSGSIYPVNAVKDYFDTPFNFNQGDDKSIYKVESPDAIEPKGKDAKVLFRYKDNNKTAGVCYDGKYHTVVLGFPFETISKSVERDEMIRQVLEYWEMKKVK